jgi:hypothetical protein
VCDSALGGQVWTARDFRRCRSVISALAGDVRRIADTDIALIHPNELLKIFDFLGVDPALFDFNSTRTLGVTGSSESRKQTAAISWDVTVEKRADFNPLARFENWDSKKRERFNWIAGEQMVSLGHELDVIKSSQPLYFIRHKCGDIKKFLKDMIASPKLRALRRSDLSGRRHRQRSD